MRDYRISLLADYYGEMLTPRALEVVRYCYDDDMSLGETAELLGVSRQAVSETLSKATAQLLQFEDKLKLFALHEALTKQTDECTRLVENGDRAEALAALEQLRSLLI